MAITGESLVKAEFTSPNGALTQIYQVPASKKALIKNLMFYHTATTSVTGGTDGWLVITDSSDVELIRIWWTTDLAAESIAASSADFIQVVGGASADLSNIYLENQQKLQFAEDDPSSTWKIRVEMSGAEEDV